jgi:hypothetical protein
VEEQVGREGRGTVLKTTFPKIHREVENRRLSTQLPEWLLKTSRVETGLDWTERVVAV